MSTKIINTNSIQYPMVNCSLCGCMGASVRCMKCNSMAFCIGCDDMYHRHPKRRQHLRQAVALEYIQFKETSQQCQRTPESSSNNIGRTTTVKKQETNSLYPWRITRTLPRNPDSLWEDFSNNNDNNGHPSKMPIPPPRLKKKNYFISGIKDTLRKWVNSPETSKQQTQQQFHPVSINQSIIKQSNYQQPNGKITNTQSNPLSNQTRKYSLQQQQQQQPAATNIRMLKTRQFATSTIDLPRSNCDQQQKQQQQVKLSSLPRKNFSQQDLNRFNHVEEQQEIDLDIPFSSGYYHSHPPQHHGSTQSMYPMMTTDCAMINPHHHHNHHQPNQCCSTSGIQCNRCSHYHHHRCPHQQPQQQIFNDQCSCFGCSDQWSTTNSLEELRRRNSHEHYYGGNDDDDDDFETDDEDDQMPMMMVNDYRLSSLSRDAKNRLRRARMKRSQSTTTMYNGSVNRKHFVNDEILVPDNRPIRREKSIMMTHSPSPATVSIKSSKSLSIDPNRSYSDTVSDSSSSSMQSRNKIIDSVVFVKNLSKNKVDSEHVQSMIGGWSCHFCTFINNSDRNVCDICCKTRLSPVEQIKSTNSNPIPKNENLSIKTDEQPIQNEQEIIFDENFVQEQIEIEKKLQQQKENELNLMETNKKFESSHQIDSSSGIIEKPIDDDSISKKIDQKSTDNGNKGLDHDDEKIVAKIIEEKISQQFEKLKLSPQSSSVVVTSNDHSSINKDSIISPTNPTIQSMNQQQFYPIKSNYSWSNCSTPLPLNQINYHSHRPSSSLSSSNNSMANNIFGLNQSMMMDSPYYQQNLNFQDDIQSIISNSSNSSLFYPNFVPNQQQQQKSLINSGKQMIQIIRDAEKKGYSSDDLEVAIQFDPVSPLEWLEKNWKNLCEIVRTISNNQIVEFESTNGNSKIENFSMITEKDAKIALRLCKGNLLQSIEKCVQRYQENKLFDSNVNKNLPTKSEFFAMKVTGVGSGRANNDANHLINANDNLEFQESNNAKEFNLSKHSKLPMEEFLQSPDGLMDKDKLLEFYLENIRDSKNLPDFNQLETLIMNWQKEKMINDQEREQSRIREKERQKMQKLIDIQKRIDNGGGGSGYLSDGTTTEEELDREVARVFQNRPSLSSSELMIDSSDHTPIFTEQDINRQQQQSKNRKQRIETKLNELVAKHTAAATAAISSSNDENITPIQQTVVDAEEELSPISISAESDDNFTDAVAEIESSSPLFLSSKQQQQQNKQIKAQIVIDQIYKFMATTQPVKNVAGKFSIGNPICLLSTKKIMEKIYRNPLNLQTISSINTDVRQPQTTGNPILIQPAETPKLIKSSPVNKLESAEPESSSLSIVEKSNSPLSSPVEQQQQYSYEFQWARTELECELCTRIVSIDDIIVMITCQHYACHNCMKNYLQIQIREQQRLVIQCPFCNEPDIGAEQDEKVFEYLAIFDPFIRHIIDRDVYELFQRKMRDRALMRDPNFLWCIKCSSGFIVPNPKALTVICPDCRHTFCRSCKKQWKQQHLNQSCEQFALWEKDHSLDYAEQLLNKHLEEFGIECPNCHFRYQLAKGGCMHFRCTQCSFDFCGGCYRPFKLGSRCFRAKVCERLGLHAHHPRNCLFYLRDKDISDLRKLLDENHIEYKTDDDVNDQNKKTTTATTTSITTLSRCQVMEQKEVNFAMKDKPCNRFVDVAGLCKLHYKEYLGNLIYRNRIDPISIFNEMELELTLKRENIRIPSKIRGEDYLGKLKELILEKIPL
ncbi:linear Ubiquitin E3 ligase isoform X1 [Dermatophagoides pteronyssinus]|uniref:linear Ubiquitin E3 ligase isoform X1 n=1 Tax=Dermatophagoides pteronyssinus TaxID=6956 RepID=UPI003F676300